MKKLLYIAIVTLLICACSTPTPKILGNISGAEGKTIYLYELTLGNTQIIDSVKLKSDGRFTFKLKSTEYPELYRLNIDNKQLILAVDSTETILINTTFDDFAYTQVEGSDNTNAITALRASLREKPLDEHKQYAREIILSNPRNLVAYYALFQQKAGQFIFDLYDKADRPYFSAVATSWNAFMPNNPRSKAVYRLTLDAIQQERKELNRQIMQDFIDNSENSFLDISMEDENGKMRYLSDLRGKVILLDFSAIAMDNSAAYLFELKELYNAYHNRGLEIYSVSADSNKLLWEDSAQNLPWITVWAEKGVYNQVFSLYNVQTLPTLYLFDRKGEVVGRYTDFNALKKSIETNL